MPHPRFLAKALTHDVVLIQGPQAHHALHVLRLGIGDDVTLIDGRGTRADGVITNTTKSSFSVRLTGRSHQPQTTAGSLILAVAPPKGPRGDWLVEKTAELGVTVLWPLKSARGEVLPRDTKLDRWRRKAVEAAKQARTPNVMQIHEPAAISDILEATKNVRMRCYADPGLDHPPVPQWLETVRIAAESPLAGLALIGPEGGFADAERVAFDVYSVSPISLGTSILRVETAAIVFAAIWSVSMPLARTSNHSPPKPR